MSKWKSAGNDLIWKALVMHGERFIAKLLKFVCLFMPNDRANEQGVKIKITSSDRLT